MHITRLLFVETGTYNDMALRPYRTHLGKDTADALTEATRGGSNLAASNLAGIAGAIIQPSAMATGAASIPYGWNERRFRFLMEIHHDGRFGEHRVQFLTGYTDHCETTLQNQRVDPNMRLFINNTVTMMQVTEMGPFGPRQRLTMSEASQIVSGTYNPSFQTINQSAHTLRPQDVFDTIGLQVVDQGGGELYDPRTSFGGGAKKSRRDNTSAPTYLSRLLSGYKMAMAKADDAADMGKIMESAAGSVKEGLITNDLALGELRRQTSFAQGTSVTFGELCALSPGLDSPGINSPVRVMLDRGVVSQGFQTHTRGSSEIWTGSSTETVMATILSHSVPSIMMDLMLTEVAMTFTNQTLHGGWDCRPSAQPHSFLEMPGVEAPDLTPYLQVFMNRMEVEVLRDLTQNNHIPISVAMHVDLLGETEIFIAIAGASEPIRYVTPSFCDNLMTPILTNNNQSLRELAHDISTLSDVISMDRSPTPSFHQGGYSAPQLRSEF